MSDIFFKYFKKYFKKYKKYFQYYKILKMMLKTKPKPYPYTLLGFDYFPIYYLLIIANPNFALLYIYNKINVN